MNIDEKTKIPLFAAIVTIPFVIGGILWLTSIDAKATSADQLANYFTIQRMN